MKTPRFSIGSGPGDFMPLVIGAVFLFISVPRFVLLLIETGEDLVDSICRSWQYWALV